MNGYDEMMENIDEGRDYICEKDGDPEGYEISEDVEQLVSKIINCLNSFSDETGRKTYIDYTEERIVIDIFK